MIEGINRLDDTEEQTSHLEDGVVKNLNRKKQLKMKIV